MESIAIKITKIKKIKIRENRMVLLCLTTISREELRKPKKLINIKIREKTMVLLSSSTLLDSDFTRKITKINTKSNSSKANPKNF